MRSIQCDANRRGLDKRLFTGEVAYVPLLNGTQPQFGLEGFKVEGKAVNLSESPVPATLSHPNRNLEMFESHADLLMSAVPGVRTYLVDQVSPGPGGEPITNKWKRYMVPCNTTTPLVAIIGGEELPIEPSKWTKPFFNNASGCFDSALVRAYPPTFVPNLRVQLGHPFLSSVYTAFRLNGNSTEIGFARLSEAALAGTARPGVDATASGAGASGNSPKQASGSGTHGGTKTGERSRSGASTQSPTSGCGGRRASWLAMAGGALLALSW